nr:TnsA endonuclease C-terminal domain-containing protein [Bacillus sp. A260]
MFKEMSSQLIENLCLSLMQRLLNDSRSVRIITSEFDTDTHLSFGSSVTLFYHLLARKIIVIDMLDL